MLPKERFDCTTRSCKWSEFSPLMQHYLISYHYREMLLRERGRPLEEAISISFPDYIELFDTLDPEFRIDSSFGGTLRIDYKDPNIDAYLSEYKGGKPY